MRFMVRFPRQDVNDPVAEIMTWFVSDGDRVEVGDMLCEVTTSKAAIEIEAQQAGVLHILAPEGTEIPINGILAVIGSTRAEAYLDETTPDRDKETHQVTMTRKAAKLIREHGRVPYDFRDIRGIVREKHVLERVGKTTTGSSLFKLPPLKGIGVGALKTEFLDRIRQDETFRHLPSKEKIRQYRKNGAVIGDEVSIAGGALIIAGEIVVGKGTVIGENCRLEADCLDLGEKVCIASGAKWYAHKIRIGKRTHIADDTRIDVAGGLCRESRVVTGADCLLCMEIYINACREVFMGDRVCLSPRAMVFTHSYWHGPLEGGAARFAGVTLENGAWVGAGAQVLPGVTLGEGATLVSNSVADTHIKPMINAAGIPAKQVSERRKPAGIGDRVYVAMAKHLALRLDYLGLEPEIVSPNGQTHIRAQGTQWIFHTCSGVEKVGERTIVVSTASAPDGLPDTHTWFDLRSASVSGVFDSLAVETQSTLRRFGVIIRSTGE